MRRVRASMRSSPGPPASVTHTSVGDAATAPGANGRSSEVPTRPVLAFSCTSFDSPSSSAQREPPLVTSPATPASGVCASTRGFAASTIATASASSGRAGGAAAAALAGAVVAGAGSVPSVAIAMPTTAVATSTAPAAASAAIRRRDRRRRPRRRARPGSRRAARNSWRSDRQGPSPGRARGTPSRAGGRSGAAAVICGGRSLRWAKTVATSVVPRERLLAAQALVQHARQRVLVGAAVQLVAPDLLRRDVVDRPDERPLTGEAGRRGGVPREPEVAEVRAFLAVDGADEDVPGCDVAVDQLDRVGGVEGVGDRGQQRDRPPRFERSALADQRPEVGAVDVRHGDVEHARVLAGRDDRDDVRMLQRCGQLGLPQEAPAEAVVSGQGRVQHLDGRHPVARVAGPVDDARRALSEDGLDGEPGHRRPDRKRGLHRRAPAYSGDGRRV